MSHPQQSGQHHHQQMGGANKMLGGMNDQQHPHPAMLQGMPGGHHYPGMHPVPMQNFGAAQGQMQPGVGHLGQYGAPQHMAMQGLMPQGHAMGQAGMPMPGYGRGPDGAPGGAGGPHGHGSGAPGLGGQPGVLAMQQMNHLGMGAGMHHYQGMGPVHGLPLQPGLVGVGPGHGGPPVHGQMPGQMMMHQDAADMGVGGGSSRRQGPPDQNNSTPPNAPPQGSKMGQGNQFNENSGGSHRQGGPSGQAPQAKGQENAADSGENPNAMGGDGSFQDASNAAKAVVAQESAATRGGKKQRGGGTAGQKKKDDKEAAQRKRDEKTAREQQKQEDKQRKQQQREEKKRLAQLQKRNQKSLNSQNKGQKGQQESMGGASGANLQGDQNLDNDDAVKRSQVGETMEQPQDVQENMLQAEQKVTGQKDAPPGELSQGQNQQASKNAQNLNNHGSSLAPQQAAGSYHDAANAQDANKLGRGYEMDNGQGALLQAGGNQGKMEMHRGQGRQQLGPAGMGGSQAYGEAANAAHKKNQEQQLAPGLDDPDLGGVPGRGQMPRAPYGHESQANPMAGRGSNQYADDGAAGIKGPRGDENHGAGGREPPYRPDDAQRHPAMLENQAEGAAKGDDGGRGGHDHRAQQPQQEDRPEGGRQRQQRQARQPNGQANQATNNQAEHAAQGKEAADAQHHQSGYPHHPGGQGPQGHHNAHPGQQHPAGAQASQPQQFPGQGMPAAQMGPSGANGKGGLDLSQVSSLQQQMLYMNASVNPLYLYHLNQLQGGGVMPGGLQHGAAAAQAALGSLYHVQQNAHSGQAQAPQMHPSLMQGAAAGAMGHGVPMMGPQGMPGAAIPGMHGMPTGLYPGYGLSTQQLLALQGRGNAAPGQGAVHDSRNNVNNYSVYGGGAGAAGGTTGAGAGTQGNPANTNGNQQAYYGTYQEKRDAQREQQFDEQLRKTLGELKVAEECEIEGVKLKMPHMNVTVLNGYEVFLKNESPKKILKFLRKTLYNTRQIKKTLDIRKFSRLQLTGQLERWKEQPDRIVRQKMNPRQLKIRAKRRVEQQRLLEKGEKPKKYECPVYRCYCKFHTEDELLEHYDKDHADLVQLGLQLRRSKKSKRELQRKKDEDDVEQIHLDGGQQRNKDKKKQKDQGNENGASNKDGSDASSGVSSCSSSDSEGAEEGPDRSWARARPHLSDSYDDKYEEMKKGNNHKDIFGHGNVDGVDDVLQADSDLEDLHELEKIELRQRKAREESRMRRRQRMAEKMAEAPDGLNQDEMQLMDEQSAEEKEQGCELFSTHASNHKLDAIAQLVKKKKERLDGQMRAKISNKFLTQLFMFSLVNKAFIRETLHEECLKAEIPQDSDEDVPVEKTGKSYLQAGAKDAAKQA